MQNSFQWFRARDLHHGISNIKKIITDFGRKDLTRVDMPKKNNQKKLKDVWFALFSMVNHMDIKKKRKKNTP